MTSNSVYALLLYAYAILMILLDLSQKPYTFYDKCPVGAVNLVF